VFREIAPSTRLAWFRRCGSGHHDDGLKGHQQPDLADSCDGLAISSSHKAGLADLQPEVSGPVRGQIAARGEKIWEGVRGGRRSVAPLSNLPPPGGRKQPPLDRQTRRKRTTQKCRRGPTVRFKAVASLVLRVWEMAEMRK
jgi:hypothetical protein